MQDKDYYDENLQTDVLVCCNLKKEAKRAVKDIVAAKEELEKFKGKKDLKGKDTTLLGNMKKISYNIRAHLDMFVVE